MTDTTEKIPCFFPKNFFLPHWEKKEGFKVAIEDACLSMDKAAPKVRNPPPEPPAPPPEKTAPKKKLSDVEKTMDLLIRISDAIDKFQTWLNAPPPPPAVPTPQVKPQKKKIPPFDLQDLPGAMDAMGLKKSALLLRKWFAGAINYPRTGVDKINSMNQQIRHYDTSYIDTTTITLDWILSFPRAKIKFEALQTYEYLSSAKGIEKIVKKLRQFPNGKRAIKAYEEAGNDRQKRHELFQFQIISVDVDLNEKFNDWKIANFERGGIPDDMMGALGGFAMYASIEHAEIEYFHGGRRVATITHVAYYMKNPYSFFDDDPKTGSQYLGHWNKTGVVLVPAAFIGSRTGMGDASSYPVEKDTDGHMKFPVSVGAISEKNVFYPVRNKDLHAWQMKHGQGGDMLLFSDMKMVRLDKPIVVEL